MNMPLVSIIIPVYNVEKYLRQCIDSVLNQTYRNIEVILVDDGSKDNSLEICNEYTKKDNRIIVISKQHNGVSDTRNVGIDISSGEYISFVDSDDMIKSEMIEILLREMLESKVEMVNCSFEYDYSGHRVPKKSRLPTGIYDVSSLRNSLIDDGTMSGILFGSACGVLYKRSIINDYNIRFDITVKYNEDGLFNINYLQFCNSIKVLGDDSDHLYIYRYNEKSASNVVNLNEDKFLSANIAIERLIGHKNINNIKEQMCARRVSITLWEIIEICSANNKDNTKNKLNMIKDLLSKTELKEGLNYIKPSKLTRYKLLYYYLIKYKLVCLVYLLTRYIYPLFRRIVSR